jgi:hypothetical protein
MKNVWKGLILGALTGAGIGLILDVLEWLGRRGKELSIEARQEAQHLGAVARARVEESDLPDTARAAAERARSAASTAKERVTEKVADTVDDVTDRLKDADIGDRAADIADRAGHAASDLADRAREVSHSVGGSAREGAHTARESATVARSRVADRTASLRA